MLYDVVSVRDGKARTFIATEITEASAKNIAAATTFGGPFVAVPTGTVAIGDAIQIPKDDLSDDW